MISAASLGPVHASQPITSEASLLGKAVKWLRAPNEVDLIKGARKALAIFLAIILSCTLIGIISVVLGALAWKTQNGQSLAVDTKTGVADLDLETFDAYKFQKVEEEEVLEKQDQIVAVNPKHGIVSLEDLKKHDLLPTNKIVLGDVSYYCSDVFKLDKHFVAIALIEIDGEVYPRLLYHSNSQGTWRVMPSATKWPKVAWGEDADLGKVEKEIKHYGKGQCETDTQLPISVICALNALPTSNASLKTYKAGNLVETVDFKKEIDFLKQVEIDQSVFMNEGANKGFYRDGMIIPFPSNPKDMHMPANKDLHPDFSAPVAEFEQNLPHYGDITVRIFASKDKSLLYMFYEASDGRAFLASTECIKDVKINSFGVREKIIEIEHMDAPLLEYNQQIPNQYLPKYYLSRNRYESDMYDNNWNYVRELEIIDKYYWEQNRKIPGPV